MNLNIEACRNCPTQCALETKADEIITLFQKGKITTIQAKQKVSVMSQWAANTPHCPSSQINKERVKIADQTGNHTLRRLTNVPGVRRP